jgi:putative tricarboxylic transport membrane protein
MRVSDTAIGLVLIVFSISVLLHTRTFPSLEEGYPGPALFPNVLAVLLIIAGLTLTAQGVRRGEKLLKLDVGELTGSGLVNILLVLGAVLFYIFLSDFLGFQITSFVLLFGLMKWLRVSTLRGLVMACGVTLGIYLLFAKMLLVPLPWGLWGW